MPLRRRNLSRRQPNSACHHARLYWIVCWGRRSPSQCGAGICAHDTTSAWLVRIMSTRRLRQFEPRRRNSISVTAT
jgi:hypothetical protein